MQQWVSLDCLFFLDSAVDVGAERAIMYVTNEGLGALFWAQQNDTNQCQQEQEGGPRLRALKAKVLIKRLTEYKDFDPFWWNLE